MTYSTDSTPDSPATPIPVGTLPVMEGRTETPEEWRARVTSIGFGKRTRDKIVEGRRPDGIRVKATTDELNNTVTEHATKEDRVDVLIRAPHITFKGDTIETRQQV